MFKSVVAVLLVILSITLSSCSIGVAGLKSYVNTTKGYEFLYPNSWIPVEVNNASDGVEVVFRDLIERTENLSLIVSDVPEGKSLKELGTPSDVGYRLLKVANNASDSNRQVELINAESRQLDNQTYYILEYEVTLPSQQIRHNLASVAVQRGQLFTFNVSTVQGRWEKFRDTFQTVVNSFSLIY